MLAAGAPDPAGGAHDAPPDPLVGWGGGGGRHPSQEPHASRRLDPRAFSIQRSLLGATFLQGGPKKTGPDNFCNYFVSLLLANFHNFWHIYTTGNLQPEDI